MHECFLTISKFDLSTDYVSSGMAFLGWRDRRRLDQANDLLNFSFSKFFPGRLAEPMMLTAWNFFTDSKRLMKMAERDNVQFSFHVLQQPNDDVMVIYQCAQLPVQARVMSMFIIFRLRVGDAFIIVTRTISSPSIQQTLQEDETWVDLFYWTQFKSVADGTEVTWGGSMAPKHCPPMSQFLIESLSNVVLWESECLPPMTLLGSSNC
ncbi:hypothetical protein PINS_up018749 [Pythium insidiosum]|nr:hypothetical protein PINS_up004021 [Pythium insidiosum]GLD95380.1 hypothetical protein PINS_up004024 [Pythium insidiosum]GLE07920.1 hypothetical protein PINS_up018749 [Pythium insidiosum]